MAAELTQTYTVENLNEVANWLFDIGKKHTVWLFEGELGAGKTTLIREVARLMEVKEEVSSPSFGLVNQYEDAGGNPIYHLDLYRLKSLEEAIEIGLTEMVDSGYFCLIEWASAIDFQPVVPFVRIQISHIDLTSRLLSVTLHEN